MTDDVASASPPGDSAPGAQDSTPAEDRPAVGERMVVDVVVVGAGPAGIAAAVTAARAGRSVVLLDAAPRPGGQIWRHVSRDTLPRRARAWIARLDRAGVMVRTGATVVDGAEGRLTVALDGGETTRVDAGAIVLATGARELFVPFPGWTLPGVVGAGGVQALLKSGAELRGRTAVVAGSGPLLLPVAAALRHAGVRVAAVVEQAPAGRVSRFALGLWASPHRAMDAARYRFTLRGSPYRLGAWVAAAHGDDHVREACLDDGRRRWTIPCDLLAVGYGLVPAVELPRWLGCDIRDGAVVVDRWQLTSRPGVFCAGEPTGIAGVDAALIEGRIAGAAAAGDREGARRLLPARTRARRFARRLENTFALREELRGLPEPDTIVCRCEDVPFGRIRPEWGPRQTKLRTRAGMGPCQGRVCGAALAFLHGWPSDSVRTPIVAAPVRSLAESAEH